MLAAYPKLSSVYKNLNLFWLGLILAQFIFLTTLNLPYQGEEGVYTITALEMAFKQEWFIPTLYGENYARPPLFNWFILLVGYGLKWQHILIASRIVTAFATSLTSLVLIWLVQKLFHHKSLALFSGLLYLSGDVLFRRGWLAYADPLFSLFVFSSIVCLWMSLQENQSKWLLGAALNLIASFLTKAITGYIFYGVTAAILYWQHSKRNLLLKAPSVILHGAVLLFPLFWNTFISKGSHVDPMLQDIITKFSLKSFEDYLFKIFLYPIETIIRWLPASVLLLYFWIKKIHKKELVLPFFTPEAKIALWILGCNYIPYWLAPQSHIRYLMPLYPLLALIMAYIAWGLDKEKIRIIYGWLMVGILMRYIAGLFVFPYYEKNYRGDYQAIAYDILTFVQHEDLYVEDYSAVGLSVIAYIDMFEMPKRILTRPAPTWKEGFLITNTPEVPDTQISKIYPLRRHALYLLCKGSACQKVHYKE